MRKRIEIEQDVDSLDIVVTRDGKPIWHHLTFGCGVNGSLGIFTSGPGDINIVDNRNQYTNGYPDGAAQNPDGANLDSHTVTRGAGLPHDTEG